MTLPVITRAQVEPVIERALRKHPSDGSTVFLVRGDPASVPATVEVDGVSATVIGSSSPLEIRAHLARQHTGTLIVVTGCERNDLGDDVLARVVDRKVHSIDRWTTVAQLFGVDQVSRTLSQRKALADALIEAQPVNGYQPVTERVLSLEAALDELLRVQLRLDPGTLADLLRWADTPAAAHAVRDTPSSVLDDLQAHTVERVGPAANIVFGALRTGRQHQLMSVLLAADAVLRAETPSERALVRLEDTLGRHDNATLIQATHAARERTAGTVGAGVRPGDGHEVVAWLTAADRLLATWEVAEQAIRSDMLPSGFTQRIAAAAARLDTWRTDPDSTSAAKAVDAAIEQVAAHRSARDEEHRVQRLRMAARLIRRGSFALDTDITTAELARRYTSDGSWLDRARIAVSQSDSEPTAAALFEALTTKADEERRSQGAALAAVTAGVAQPLGDELIGMEDVLDDVVAPLAASVAVLVVVLDGMGWPTFTDVLERIEARGWDAYADHDLGVAKPLVATLPTVTELSRTSLLCGTLRSGNKESERRAFTAHPRLIASGAADRPPQLFHKTDLRAGGLDAIPHDALEAIRDDRNRVVGIVLNNIDERLKDVSQPVGGWGLDELTPLREILDAARIAGRAVVLTADHGHVLERDSAFRPGGGGERWRGIDSGPVGDGEIAVRGPRVVNDEHAVVLPWLEQLRYGPSKNGYHGGITLAEVVVPLVVLASEEIPGWKQSPVTAPAWWHPPIHSIDPTPPQPAPKTTATKRSTKKTPQNAIPLFEPEQTPASTTSTPPAAGGGTGAPMASPAVEAILATDAIAAQLSALRLDAELVAGLLGMLDSTGGTPVAEARVADSIGYPRNRIGRLVNQVQRLVNIDGYNVIATANGDVRFDRELLERQLGL